MRKLILALLLIVLFACKEDEGYGPLGSYDTVSYPTYDDDGVINLLGAITSFDYGTQYSIFAYCFNRTTLKLKIIPYDNLDLAYPAIGWKITEKEYSQEHEQYILVLTTSASTSKVKVTFNKPTGTLMIECYVNGTYTRTKSISWD